MRFSVLGPLVVTGPTGTVALPAGRSAAAACWLIAHVNEPVSDESLIAVLWPDEPDDAHGKVHALVRGLADRLEGHIVRADAHVTLTAGRDDVDAVRFEWMLSNADRHLGAGDVAAAGAELEAALRLWRGEPYRELERALAALPLVERLVERHHAAIEDLVGLRLCGRVDYALVADLRAAVTRVPDRPRLWRQLALALYRTGRQVEAIDLLAERRQADGDSAELVLLQNAILRQDPSLNDGELQLGLRAMR